MKEGVGDGKLIPVIISLNVSGINDYIRFDSQNHIWSFMPLTVILIIISFPSPTLSFIPDLKNRHLKKKKETEAEYKPAFGTRAG